MVDSRIQGFATVVEFADKTIRQVVAEVVGTPMNCVEIEIARTERVSILSHLQNWEAFAVTVAEQNKEGEWVNTKIKSVFGGMPFDMPYEERFGVGLDFDYEIDPATRKLVGVQGLFENGIPTGLDWILLDTTCVEEEEEKERQAEEE